MPPTTTHSALESNLAGLRGLNADLAERLRQAAPDPSVEFGEIRQDCLTAVMGGRQLCSRHRPRDEAQRIADRVNLMEKAVVVVLGFGLGYHVRAIAERLGKAGIIIVFEPDVPLLRAVLERIDHASWIGRTHLLIVTDGDDRAALARTLEGTEAVIAQGLQFVEHPPSRVRLGERSARFSSVVGDLVTATRTTLATTLVRASEMVRNVLLNLDHYAAGPGIADLQDAARGRPAVIVSAGPSLARNMHHLARPGLRERCVIIAVQTTLEPLLQAGIRPHFVTALDYHEISRRFYERLDGYDLSDVTLVVEPKVHPVVVDAYPGPTRCCGFEFADRLLGGVGRDMGHLTAGATVAHLALYLAGHLGCDPIGMIGQDLGFTDGVYYAPGTAIDRVWAPELSPFNTMEMMQWQRIMRHRLHRETRQDVHGRTIYTDAQMITYLQQFERDFAVMTERGTTIIDASEGGLPKQHTVQMTLASMLDASATETLPPIPAPPRGLDASLLSAAGARLAAVRDEVQEIRRRAIGTSDLLRGLLDGRLPREQEADHYDRIEAHRRAVEKHFEAFQLLNQLNQLGVYRRMKADRRILLASHGTPQELQAAKLQRDLDNVEWIRDAGAEFVSQLHAAEQLLAGEPVDIRSAANCPAAGNSPEPDAAPRRIAAIVPIDPRQPGLDPVVPFAGRTVLQATLERLGQCDRIDTIVLIVPEDFDVEPVIDRSAIGRPLVVESVDGSPFPPEHECIRAARAWSDTAWRGGVAGVGAHDELLCPQVMHEIMNRRGFGAALLAGPNWPLLDVSAESGCAAVVTRHLERADRHDVVFTQAPPGLGPCLVSAKLMGELAERNRLSTIGGLLVYQPHAPQGDPVATDANVQIDATVRDAMLRCTLDSPHQQRLLEAALQAEPNLLQHGPAEVIAALRRAADTVPRRQPRHIIMEITTRRTSCGLFAQRRGAHDRPDMDVALAERIFAQLDSDDPVALTLDGGGDPLLHEQLRAIIDAARAAGVEHVHVRTELLGDAEQVDRLMACQPAVVSVELHADRAATYETMMGVDRFRDVLVNLDRLLGARRRYTPQNGTIAMALPWVVPRLQRCLETYDDIDTFFDRWQCGLGTCVIEPPPPGVDSGLADAGWPQAAIEHELSRRMTILSDGSVPVCETDRAGRTIAGRLGDEPLGDLWAGLQTLRASAGGEALLWSP